MLSLDTDEVVNEHYVEAINCMLYFSLSISVRKCISTMKVITETIQNNHTH